MKNNMTRRVTAMIGVILLLGLFVSTIIFLIMGYESLAIASIAANALLALMLYFMLYFSKNKDDEDDDTQA